MAAAHDDPPTFRRESPSPETTPAAPALRSRKSDLARCVSIGSAISAGSSTDESLRESFGSEPYSRHSSASYTSRRSDISFVSSPRQSTFSFDRPGGKRRGFTRPQGTEFATSARHRESVLSLGSISHLQYYFARTGLLDGKGGQLARKRNPRATLDLSQLEATSFLSGSDADSSYASMVSSPDLGASGMDTIGDGTMVESPVEDNMEYNSDEFDETDPDILPPTTSTYIHREKPVPKPPTLEELKTDLTKALDSATEVLHSAAVRSNNGSPVSASNPQFPTHTRQPSKVTGGWHQVQGMQILDTMTLAIRAAKVYYTSHEHPDRLDTIKSEKEIRTELLNVMEVLKHMATRNFAGGARDDEQRTMVSWIEGILAMLKKEEDIVEAERKERASWQWLSGDWTGREIEREIAFLASLGVDEEPLPAWTPADKAATLPTPFLASLQSGLRLVKLHNAAVCKSRRRFGTIPVFHTDTQKPYRAAENLRFWVKAAELRWETVLKVDALGVAQNNSSQVWLDFETALWKWCRKVREEITAEWQNPDKSTTSR